MYNGMNRLVGHHAASSYKLSKEAKEHYHKAIDGDGQVLECKHKIEHNAAGRKLTPGTYAAHTLNLNSGAIGVAILAMGDTKDMWATPYASKYPVLQRQLDAYILLMADLARQYDIPVEREFILTHAEVQPTLNVKQKNKWDFDYYPVRAGAHLGRDPVIIGDELRQEIRAKMGDGVIHRTLEKPKSDGNVAAIGRGVVRQGTSGANVQILQKMLGLKPDAVFGPTTRDVVIKFQRANQLRPDGVVGEMTWRALVAKYPKAA